MRLYFIRHGQSTNNVLAHLSREEIEMKRTHDPELTEIGVRQAECAAAFLKEAVESSNSDGDTFAFTKIYVSPMIRALNTAKPIVEALDAPAHVWTDIFETGGLFTADLEDNVRTYPGLNCDEFKERYPDYVLPETVTEAGWWSKGRERPEDFMGRAIKVALELRRQAHTSDQLLLVSHAAFLDSVIKALLGQLPRHPHNLFYNHYNTGITRIDFAESSYSTAPDHIRIHYMNRVDHLPAALRTW